MTFSTKVPRSHVSPRTARLSPRSVVLAAAFAALGGAAAGACGGSSSTSGTAGTQSGGSAARIPLAGEGGETSSGGSAARGGTSSGASGKSGSSSGGTGGSGASASGGTAALAGSAGSGTVGSGTTCDNGLDDDDDGLVDGLDPECTGPLDNDEASFATGIPGDNKDPKWQDCFFDGNSGGGDDGCRYPTECLYGTTAADDPDCELSQQCIDFCTQRAPNGCDCFGCCSVQTDDGSSVDIYTTATCALDRLDDEEACPRCQKSIACDNPCGECELCPGKTIADLPASCASPPDGGEGGYGGGPDGTGGTSGNTDGGMPPPVYTCDNGRQVCGPGLPLCEGGLYCQLGCCTLSVR